MTVIHKTPEDWRVVPHLTDYEQTRAAFRWSAAPNPCGGMPSGGCNIAYAAVDRHADGPLASRTALRFVSAPDRDGAEATRDMSYVELGRLARRFTNVLRSLRINKGNRVFTLMGRSPELYISILGALRNGSVVSPLFSAFGPEPIATRLNIGEADVLVTTRAIYQKKIAKMQNQLPSLQHIFVVDDHRDNDDAPGIVNFWYWMDKADETAPIEPTTADDPALLHFTSGTTGKPKGAVHVHEAVTCTTPPASTSSTFTPTTSTGARPTPAG